MAKAAEETKSVLEAGMKPVRTTQVYKGTAKLSDIGFPRVEGKQKIPSRLASPRHKGGESQVSNHIFKACALAIQGMISNVQSDGENIYVKTKSTSGGQDWWTSMSRDWTGDDVITMRTPHQSVTWQVGAHALVHALISGAPDVVASYTAIMGLIYNERSVQDAFQKREVEDEMIRLSDCVATYLRFGMSESMDDEDMILPRIGVLPALKSPPNPDTITEKWDTSLLFHASLFQREIGRAKIWTPVGESGGVVEITGFIGPQLGDMYDSIANGWRRFLIPGPTATGKTFMIKELAKAIRNNEMFDDGFVLTMIRGMEGLEDVDFVGALLPTADGTRKWVDGPLIKAMRYAQTQHSLLFIDEGNRIPTEHMNIMLHIANTDDGETMKLMGIEEYGDGLDIEDGVEYIVYEVPLTGEKIVCPADNLIIAMAGNFGGNYAVYELDPAVMRRLETIIEFNYLPTQEEMALVHSRNPRAPWGLIEALVKTAQQSRDAFSVGETYHAPIDTQSLINWVRRCVESEATAVFDIMRAAELTFLADVCGRDQMGVINQDAVRALQMYIESTAQLNHLKYEEA